MSGQRACGSDRRPCTLHCCGGMLHVYCFLKEELPYKDPDSTTKQTMQLPQLHLNSNAGTKCILCSKILCR